MVYSLGTRRGIGPPNPHSDVAIKVKLESMRVVAQDYDTARYLSTGTASYSGFCSDPRARELLDGIAQHGKTGVCNDSDDAWAACSPLYNDVDKNWCVDSKGNSKSAPNITCASSWKSTECP